MCHLCKQCNQTKCSVSEFVYVDFVNTFVSKFIYEACLYNIKQHANENYIDIFMEFVVKGSFMIGSSIYEFGAAQSVILCCCYYYY